MARLVDSLGTVEVVARAALEHEIKYPAAAVAYYAFVSIVPWLVLVLAVLGEQIAVRIGTVTPRLLAPEARGLIYDATTTASGRTGAVALAIVALAWSGANIAVGFRTVVERVERAPEGPLVEQLRDTATVLGSLFLAVVAIVLTSALFALFPARPAVRFLRLVALFGALAAVFLPMYYVPSEVVTSWTGALPGALAAALGWTVLLSVLQLYALNAARYAIYGILGGIILVLTSLYVAAIVLMLGVVVNTTLAGSNVPGFP